MRTESEKDVEVLSIRTGTRTQNLMLHLLYNTWSSSPGFWVYQGTTGKPGVLTRTESLLSNPGSGGSVLLFWRSMISPELWISLMFILWTRKLQQPRAATQTNKQTNRNNQSAAHTHRLFLQFSQFNQFTPSFTPMLPLPKRSVVTMDTSCSVLWLAALSAAVTLCSSWKSAANKSHIYFVDLIKIILVSKTIIEREIWTVLQKRNNVTKSKKNKNKIKSRCLLTKQII